MTSNKQQRKHLDAKRRAREQRRQLGLKGGAKLAVNEAELRPNDHGCPYFLRTGFYADREFRCIDCDRTQTWRAAEQNWWFEVVKAKLMTAPRRCRDCRVREKRRKAEARRLHEGRQGRKRAGASDPKPGSEPGPG